VAVVLLRLGLTIAASVWALALEQVLAAFGL